jgi:FAD/FMN-containing dehydrogenase
MRGEQAMKDALHGEALEAIERIFGDRTTQGPVGEEGAHGEALAVVSPLNVREVELLAEVAGRYSLPLAALGAGTALDAPGVPGKGVLVRFDLMRDVRIRGGEELWVRAEPGAPWLELENNLSTHGWGLAVYPTSAPRATVGGWLATDGLGVGSFEYGRLSENVLSADVVLAGGELRTLRGEELRPFVRPGDTAEDAAGLVVAATLRTRRADADVPFAAAYDEPEDLVKSIASLREVGAPLWHLAFLDPGMVRARRLGDGYLLFGAYPAERAPIVEGALQETFETHRGRLLPAAESYRAWGERYFPMAPSRPTPTSAQRMLVPMTEFPEALLDTQERSTDTAVQGTVSRSGEVLLLAFDAQEEGWTRR